MSGFHKPTVATVAVVLVVILIGYHFLSRRSRKAANNG
jgi:hypothetical protein